MRVRFVVHGRVHGVNFRGATVRAAREHHVTGRVWNRDDGAVELVAEGDDDALAALERWLHDGPRMADVDSVERNDVGGECRYRDFTISYGSAS